MQTWAIANQKGGVGKTTTSLCLARGLAASGARVLLIDLDPHASLTRAFRIPTDPPPAGSHDLFTSGSTELRSLARGTAIEGLLLIAAQPALATLERRGATQPGLGLSLGRALHAARDAFDHALLDCPPTLGLLMVNALAAADRLVIPTQTDPLAMHGLTDMLRTADMVERSRRRALPRNILPTLYDRRTRSGVKSLEQLHDSYEGLVWPRAVPMDTRLRDAVGLTLAEAPTGRGADAYQSALGVQQPAQRGLVGIGRDHYAFELLRVQEVVRVAPIVAMRGATVAVLGVMNLRGRIVPVFDLGRWLGGSDVCADEHSRIVVIERDDELIGVLVTVVEDVATLGRDQIEPPLVGNDAGAIVGIARVGSAPTVLLDANALFG